MKKKVGLTLGMLLGGFLLILSGCGGGSSPQKCSTTADCSRDFVCQDGVCSSVDCTSTADCPTGSICDTETGKCTAQECTTDQDCNDQSKYCDNGLCKVRTINTSDVSDGDSTSDASNDTGNNNTVKQGNDCKPCQNKAECGEGYDCIPLSSGSACLRPCQSAGDCPSGYICYAASSTGKSCVPPSYKCVECAYKGCPQGKTCNLSTGDCVDVKPVCGSCVLDWECGPDARCYHKDMSTKGVCMPLCNDNSQCPDPKDKYTCGVDSNLGVKICQPASLDVCCPSDKPHMLQDGTCVQCVTAKDCPNNQACDPATHTCSSSGCPTGQKVCPDDQKCHECCEDSDCQPGEKCDQHICIGGPGGCNDSTPCGGCNDPNYPCCVQYQGNWMCAACDPKAKNSCPTGCHCDPNSFSCVDQNNMICGSGNGGGGSCSCTKDSDCQNPNNPNQQLKCSSKGFCYDPKGKCDGVHACCDTSTNSQCYDLMGLLMGGMGGGLGSLPLPGGGGGMMMGACTCDPPAQCPDGVQCFPLSLACSIPFLGQMICPGGNLPPNAPQNVCVNVSNLLGGLLGGGGGGLP